MTKNPTDLGSTGCLAENLTESWFKGPAWLTKQDEWSEDTTTDPSAESENERKTIKEVLSATIIQNDSSPLLYENNRSMVTLIY